MLACLSVNRFFLAGLSAALPHVVARDELVMANAVSTTSGTVVAIIGARHRTRARAAARRRHRGRRAVIVVAALGYVAAAALAARMDRDLLGPDLATEPRADP